MVDKSHFDPKATHSTSGSTPKTGSKDNTSAIHYGKGGEIDAGPMTFLGMHFNSKEAKQLWNILVQNLNSQISKEKDKALAALKKLKKSETGDDSDD
jgi:hypothetical protein